MAGSVNKVIIIGNLGQDVEVRTFQNGGKVANFSVATSESWKDKQTGEKKERTEWHRISITNEKLVEIAEKYLKKGSKVYLEGQIETRKYMDKKDNIEKFITEVVLRPYRGELTLLDSKGSSSGAANDYEDQQPRAAAGGSASSGPAPRNAMDDEIPF